MVYTLKRFSIRMSNHLGYKKVVFRFLRTYKALRTFWTRNECTLLKNTIFISYFYIITDKSVTIDNNNNVTHCIIMEKIKQSKNHLI